MPGFVPRYGARLSVCRESVGLHIKSSASHQTIIAAHSPSKTMSYDLETPSLFKLDRIEPICSTRTPERIKRPHVAPSSDDRSGRIASAVRFAQTQSAEAVVSSMVPTRKPTLLRTLFS